MKVVAIDPGNVQSAYAVIQVESFYPVAFGKLQNDDLTEMLKNSERMKAERYVIERVACYGMPVGREVFDTCEWIGRFTQIIKDFRGKEADFILRMDEKITICNNSRANDGNIRRALIDRFALHDFKNGKGTKNHPDFFYGFSADMWAAYAVGYTYIERGLKGSERHG